MYVGKCPKCEKQSTTVHYRAGLATERFGTGQLTIVTYTCPSCEAILGVQTDPIALMADQTERIAKRLGASRPR